MNISGIPGLYQNTLIQKTPAMRQTQEKESFADSLMEAVRNTGDLEKEADRLTNDFISGKTDNIHSVLIAAEKASISLELIVEVRDKVLDAYNEIMRMQV